MRRLHLLVVAEAACLLAALGCGSARPHATRLTLHVDGPVARSSQGRCVFVLRARVREGGTQRTCLTSVEGFPAPETTMHSRGLMTFALPGGEIALRVRVTQRFATDGAHAQQSVRGFVARATGGFAGAHGSISGGGAVVDGLTGIRVRHLTYRLTLER